MIGYLSARCPVCGMAMYTEPADVWPQQSIVCHTERCANRGKRFEPVTVELKPKGKT